MSAEVNDEGWKDFVLIQHANFIPSITQLFNISSVAEYYIFFNFLIIDSIDVFYNYF